MAHRSARLISLATALALVLSVGVMGQAAAVDPGVTRAAAAEKYALKLLNCTRTGGWVMADGSCKGRFSGKFSAYRKPLRLHKKISNVVAWPWARKLVVNNVCGHSIEGQPELNVRIRFPGYRAASYGENVGCGWGYHNPKQLVLATHRQMQAEKKYNGGHWRNMKNGSYKSVGIGVGIRDGRVMVVYDFYGRLY